MVQSSKQHLEKLLESYETAMLITHHGSGEHARPMAVAGVEGPGTVWFVTSLKAPMIDEIRRDSSVAVTFQDGHRYVALSGRAELLSDRAKLDEFWKAAWRIWFPNGKDDPSIVLIRVTVTDAEFWDNAGANGVRYAFEAAKALLTKSSPTLPAGQHGRVIRDDGAPISRH